MTIGIDELADLVQRSDKIISHIKAIVHQPDGSKHFSRSFKMGEASALIGRHPATIREAEKQDVISSERPESSSVRGFSMTEINKARRHFNTMPRIDINEEPAVLAVQNFKGGVGKTSIAVHLSQWLAIRGFRTLLIDLDSQASATTMFGYTPDMDIVGDETLLPFFEGAESTLHYAVRDTMIENLSLIPANLQLYGAEYMIAANRNKREIFSYLPEGIATIKKDFDVIIIDPPPALGMLSINSLVAATSLLIPMPPRMLDFTSSLQFFSMLQETLEVIEKKYNNKMQYDFIKLVTSKKKQRNTDKSYIRVEDRILKVASSIFGNEYMFDSIIYESTAIENAASKFKTLFEVEGQTTSYKSYRMALASMEAMCEEVLNELLNGWPTLKPKITATVQ